MQKRYSIRIIFALLVGLSFVLVNCGGGGDGGSKKPPGPNPLDTWHERAMRAALGRIAYGNGIFVSGGDDNFLTSTDGISWTIRSSGASITDITYGNGFFVAMGWSETPDGGGSKQCIIRSEDGITWTNTTFVDSNYLYAIAYGKGIFVMVGENGSIMTSPDGVSWTSVTTGVSYRLVRITYGNGIFITTGYSIDNPTDSVILRSTDGVTWTNTTVIHGISLADITYGNGVFVTVGNSENSGTILTSPDGMLWTKRIDDGRYDFKSVTYGNGTFLLMGAERLDVFYPQLIPPPPAFTTPISGTSEDGMNWTFSVHTDLAGGWYHGTFSQVIYGNGVYITPATDRGSGYGDYGEYVFVSTDGKSWTSKYLYTSRHQKQDISYGNGLFIVVGNGVITSLDGGTWTIVGQDMGVNPSGVIYAEGNFIGVGGTSIFSSVDGKSWSAVDTGNPNYLIGIAFGNGVYVAVGENGTIFTSVDRMSWTERVSGTSNFLRSVTYGDGTFIVSQDGVAEVLVSRDGINWTKSKTEIGSEAFLVSAGSYGHGLFVLVGGAIITSPDGLHWTKRNSGTIEGSFTSITFGEGIFVAVGTNGTIVSSTDGKSWTVRNSGTSYYFKDVGFGNHTFLILGDNSQTYWGDSILQSDPL